MTHTEAIPTTEPEVIAESGDSGRSRPSVSGREVMAGEPLRRLLLVSLGLMCVAVALVFTAVARAPELSIVDEPAHAGHLYTVAHGHLPAKGTKVPAEIRYEWFCHDQAGGVTVTDNGAKIPVVPRAPAAPASPTSWESGAQEYTFGDPPVYYAVTGLLDRAIGPLVPGGHDFITVGRDLGALWLSAAMIVLYLAARRLRISWPYALAAALLVPLCPGVLAASSEVTSDAPAALCGALGLYALARLTVDKRMGLIVPFVLTVLATGTKVINGLPLLAVGAVALALAVTTLWRERDWRRALRPFLVSVCVSAGFLLVFGGWTVYQNHRGTAHWVNPNAHDSIPLKGSRIGDLASNLFGSFQHLTTSYWLEPQVSGESVVVWATVLCVLFCGAPLAVMAISRSWSGGWLLGLGTFVGISAVSLAVEAPVLLSSHEYFQVVSARYAITFLPWTILCLAIVAHRRRLLRTTYVFVSLGMLVVLLAEFGVVNLGPALSSHTSYLIG